MSQVERVAVIFLLNNLTGDQNLPGWKQRVA
jgi:hypothetical protein